MTSPSARSKPKVAWQCPKCGAKDGHGKKSCQSNHDQCEGLLCQCWSNFETGSEEERATDDPDHGQVFDNICSNAVCDHCGWSGQMPQPPRRILVWERKALEAGWLPPENWEKLS